ncbi:cobalt ECF transporter T component CbiQ [Chloroflexota bacterium]
MKHSFLDQYSDLNSFIHKLDPRTKFISTLVFIMAVTLTPPGYWLTFACYFVLVATLIFISKVPLFYILKRSLVIMPFVLLIAIFVPFFKEGEVAVSYSIWIWQISVTYDGLQVLGSILTKAWLSILCLILLTATTRITNLLAGLEEMRMPRVMVMILSFMYRYIFVLIDEVFRMKMARDSRNFGGSRFWHLKTIGNMTGTLFIRSYERGERVYAAMLARGFDGHSRTMNQLSFRRTDVLFGVSFGLIIVLACVLGFLR